MYCTVIYDLPLGNHSRIGVLLHHRPHHQATVGPSQTMRTNTHQQRENEIYLNV